MPVGIWSLYLVEFVIYLLEANVDICATPRGRTGLYFASKLRPNGTNPTYDVSRVD